MAFVTILACLGLPAFVHGRVSKVDEAHGSLRNGMRKDNKRCPGLGSPCTGNGECVPATGTCLCKYGWGGTDCGQSVTSIYELTYVSDPQRQDMKGVYDMVPMYLQEGPGDPHAVKFVHYDPESEGWAVSKLNSSCNDDICFFASAKDEPVPPPKGYVFGVLDKHFYYKQLMFDDKELYPDRLPGYHMNVAYSPDPNVAGIPSDLDQLTGRYLIQPRFIHKKTGKYAIMPVNLQSPGKTWVFLELAGRAPNRHWKIIAEAKDPSINRYTVPKGPWEPAELQLTLVPSCRDHVTLDTCFTLRDYCKDDSKDRVWVRSCCRQTCGACRVPASECKLPKTSIGFDGTLLQTVKNISSH